MNIHTEYGQHTTQEIKSYKKKRTNFPLVPTTRDKLLVPHLSDVTSSFHSWFYGFGSVWGSFILDLFYLSLREVWRTSSSFRLVYILIFQFFRQSTFDSFQLEIRSHSLIFIHLSPFYIDEGCLSNFFVFICPLSRKFCDDTVMGLPCLLSLELTYHCHSWVSIPFTLVVSIFLIQNCWLT